MSVYDFLTNSKFVTSVATAITTASLIGAFKYGRDYLLGLRLKKRLEEDDYTPTEIKRSAAENRDTYVRPDCQDNNPAGTDAALNRRPLFEEIDRLLGPPLQARFSLLLADSGMGKTTFFTRYYAYHWSRPKRSRRFKLVVVPLNRTDCNDIINGIDIQERGETVLLLDALDEDNAAIADFDNRFQEIVEIAGKFRAVVISCRTQFLAGAACIPEEVDIAPLTAPAGLAGGPDRKVRQVYVSTLSDQQVERYLSARFPRWRNPIFRVRAGRAAMRFKDLMSRPLLLTYIQDLVSATKEPQYTFQVYRSIVNNWLTRETRKRRLASKPEDLLRFSEEFAGRLYSQGQQRMSLAELDSMAKQFSVVLDAREVRERSLLHNDAEDHWSFAHRSIMEYFLVSSLCSATGRPLWIGQPWTDQMRVFGRDMLRSGECQQLRYADLKGMDLKQLQLSNADLSGTDMTGADLRGACLHNSNLDFVSLEGVRFENVNVCGQGLQHVRGLTLRQALEAASDESTSWPSLTLETESASVDVLAISADGRLAVSTSNSRELRVWDLASGRRLHSLKGHSAEITCIAVSENNRLVSASRDKTLKVWDLAYGNELHTLEGHSAAVTSVGVSARGLIAASAAMDGTLKLWDLSTGRQRRSLSNYVKYGRNASPLVAVSRDGLVVVSTSADATFNVWQSAWYLEEVEERRTVGDHSSSVRLMAVSPDGFLAICACSDGMLKVWDLGSGHERHVLDSHSADVTSLAMSRNGELAVSASADGTVKVWDLETGTKRLTLKGQVGRVLSCVVDPSGNFILSGLDNGLMMVWFPPSHWA